VPLTCTDSVSIHSCTVCEHFSLVWSKKWS